MEDEDIIPLACPTAVLTVNDEAYVCQLPTDGSSVLNWVKADNKVVEVVCAKERMMGAMLQDMSRNNLYKEAIQRVVKPGDVVLDAGSGTGFLSLLCAQAGASKVLACEMNDVFSHLSRDIVCANGFESIIECLPCRTTDVNGIDKVDVIVTETMDSILTTEGIYATLLDCKDRLGKPMCRTIPQSATIRGRLVRLHGPLLEMHKKGGVMLFHADGPRAMKQNLEFASQEHALLSLRFEHEEELTQTTRLLPLNETTTSEVHALLCYWDVELAPGIVLSTCPTENAAWQDHWHHALFFLDDNYSALTVTLNPNSGCLSVIQEEDSTQQLAKRQKSGKQEEVKCGRRWMLPHDDDEVGLELSEVDHALLLLYQVASHHVQLRNVHNNRARVYCASVGFAQLFSPRLHLESICGLDHRLLVDTWKSKNATFPLCMFDYEFHITSGKEDLIVATMDFEMAELSLSQANATLTTTREGTNALAFWIEWESGGENKQTVSFSNPRCPHPAHKTDILFLDHVIPSSSVVEVSLALDVLTNRFVFNAKTSCGSDV